MDIQEYFRELEKHDWYYSFSDDNGAYRRGHENEMRLKAIAAESEKHQRLYDGFMAHFSSGDAWGTPKQPKPTLEDFLN